MKILFLGDFYFDCDEIPDDLLKISEYIKDNNLVTVLNLEGTIRSEKPLNKGVCLSFSNKFIDALKLLNVKAVSLANNHVMDYSYEGLEKLIIQLKEAGIGYFGAGKNLSEASKPYIMNIENKSIALMGMGWKIEECINAKKNSPGTCPLDYKLLNEVVNNTVVDVFIPILHQGYEYESLPQPLHVKECRRLIQNEKVKLIIGHHPHVVQAYENNIFYSLGNFFFGNRRTYFDQKKDRMECNKGIGVIFDTQNFNYEVIKLEFNGKNTIINDLSEIKNFQNISDILIEEYTDFFFKNNNFKNKNYVYKIGFINEALFNKFICLRRNVKKIFLRRVKWPLIKFIKKIIGSD